MESNKKSFARKVVALFLAVLMAVSCFSAAFSAYAANNNRQYNDDKLASNIMGWADATDEQTLEAVFDYVDTVLAGSNINLDLEQNIVVANISIHAKLRSVDDIIDLVGNQLPANIKPLKNLAGDVKLLNFGAIQNLQSEPNSDANGGTSACGKSYRAVNSAKVIIKHLCQFLVDNTGATGSAIHKLLNGTFTLGGIAEGALKGTVYDKLRPMLGTPAGYQSDFFYNVTKAMMLSKTGWFTPEEVKQYESGAKPWNLDTVTREKLNELLVPQISAWVTYTVYNNADPKNIVQTESSAERLDKIQAHIKANGGDYAAACTALGYDPNLRYCTIDTLENNINIFEYGNDKLTINADTTFYSFAAQAFKLAWKTVLKDTLQLVHVNHDNWKQDGSPTNFDNDFFYYLRDNNKWIIADSKTDGWKANYTKANVEAWAADRAPKYGMTQQEFIDAAKAEATSLSRTLIENPTYTWKDLEIMQFFNKLRYSPLADIYFDVQTGPLNLYLLQTGFVNTAAFLDTWSADSNNTSIDQPGILDEFNNGLVAMCKDLFMEGKNIGYSNPDGSVTPIARPTFVETSVKFVRNAQDHNDAAKMELVDAITDNFFMLIEYLLNASDVNVLANLYNTTGIPFDGVNYQLTEANLEKSMLPLLIAAVNEVQINGQRLMDQIHDETWDKCTSVEAVAIFVLEEHLAWVLPDKDYHVLYTFNEAGDMVAALDMNNDGKKTLLEDVILIMTRDAVGYQLAPILPLRHKDVSGKYVAWSPYDSKVQDDKTDLFEILNCVIVFYAGTNKWTDDDGTESQGMAGVLGVVDKTTGDCKITLQNTLFQNIDLIVDHLLPFFGILQNGDMASAGKFDSHELLIEVLVDGALDIATKKDTNKIFAGTAKKDYSGLKVFLYQLLTIISCDPIMNMDAEHVLYDVVLCPIINNVFGARYDNKYPHIIPTSAEMNTIYGNQTAGDTPIDSLFRKQVFANYNGSTGQNGIGILGILFDAIYKALGANNYADTDSKQGIEGAWNGAAFICQSVANLDQYFCPQLKTHKFGVLKAEVANATQTGIAPGAAFTDTTLNLKNESIGLNRFYLDANHKSIQDGRFLMKVKSVTAVNNNTNETAKNIKIGSQTANVMPQETAKITLTGTAENAETTVYRIDAKYDVYEAASKDKPEGATPLYKDQVATTYFVISTVKDWFRETYSNDQGSSFVADNIQPNQKNNANTNSTNWTGVSEVGKVNLMFCTFPTHVMVQTSKPGNVNKGHYRIEYRNARYTQGATSRINGLYFKFNDPDATAFYIEPGKQNTYGAETNVLNKYKAVGDLNDLGMAAIDQTTGDILHYGYYDYFDPLTNKWMRGGASGNQQHAEGGNNSDGAYIGYTWDQLTTARNNQVTDPADGKQKPLEQVPGFEYRTHVVWTYDEYMGTVDYNKQNSDDVVKFVSRTQIGIDANKQPVYKYNYALIRTSDALLYGDDGSCSMTTPIPGIYITAGHKDINSQSISYQQWLAWDGKTQIEQAKVTGDVMVTAKTAGLTGGEGNKVSVPVTFQVVDDSALNAIQTDYNNTSNKFSPYKSTDFAKVDYNGVQVNPYEKLQEALGVALKESAKIINIASADSFNSNKITVASTTDSRSQIGAIAYKRATTSDAIAPEVAVNAITSGGHYYYNDELTIPVLTGTKITDNDVQGITVQKIDNKDLSVGTTKDGNDKVVKVLVDEGKQTFEWHYINEPKMETIWDTKTYSDPYLVKTDKQVGVDKKAPVYEQVTYTSYFVDGPDNTKVLTNVIANSKDIIKPNSAPTDNRNSIEKATDSLNYWSEIAMANIAGGGADRIVTEVRDHFDTFNTEYINYDVHSFNNVKEVVNEAMSLVTTTWVDSNRPLMDPINKDQQQKNPVTGELLWEKDPVYSTTASSLQVENAIAEYQKAIGRLIKMDYSDNKLVEEIAWSTAGATKGQLTASGAADTTGAMVYTEVKSPTAYYGTVENGVIVNKTADGVQAYTDASWANYINRLGKAVTVAQTCTAKDNTRAEAFYARNDLMLAENELDPFKPETSSDITVSGNVLVATDVTGTQFTKGIIGIDVVVGGVMTNGKLVGGEVVATTAADGSFTATIPAGTKEIGFRGATTVDRVVTLAGDADVTGAQIPVVICDYNRDLAVNGVDTGLFAAALSVYDVNMDINCDKAVNGVDTGMYAAFIDQTINYAPMTIA